MPDPPPYNSASLIVIYRIFKGKEIIFSQFLKNKKIATTKNSSLNRSVIVFVKILCRL
jgi:hypothetical protein